MCNCLDPQVPLETLAFRGFWNTRVVDLLNPLIHVTPSTKTIWPPISVDPKNVHHLFAVLVLVRLVSPYSSPPIGGSSHLVAVVHNHGDCKSPKDWGCGTPSKMSFLVAYKLGWSWLFILSRMILQVKGDFNDQPQLVQDFWIINSIEGTND